MLLGELTSLFFIILFHNFERPREKYLMVQKGRVLKHLFVAEAPDHAGENEVSPSIEWMQTSSRLWPTREGRCESPWAPDGCVMERRGR